jgi:hypothetical protein
VRPLSAMGRSELMAELSAFRARDEAQAATYDAIVALIENPPPPTPALVRLMKESKEQNPDGRLSREELLAELVERRRLPVIGFCHQCFYAHDEDDNSDECQHELGEDRGINSMCTPPDWCPLRRKR